MLKYNSRTALKKELAILKCCIANKGLELANSIALALGNVKCLEQELTILTGYYEALKCYYPYDCYFEDTLMTVTKTINGADLAVIGSGTLEENLALGGNTLEVTISGVLNTTNTLVISPITDLDTLVEEINNYINDNSATTGFTSTYVNNQDSTYTFTFTVNTCSLEFSGFSLIGFLLVFQTPDAEFIYYDETPTNTSVCNAIENCGFLNVINEEDLNIQEVENCITDEEAERMVRHALSFCDCCTDININNELINT